MHRRQRGRGGEPPAERTIRIVDATNAFLGTLDEEKRSKVALRCTPTTTATAARFEDGQDGRMTFVGEQYGQAVWSNFPVSDVPRPGIRLGTLDRSQRAAAMHLLRTALSDKGDRKVEEIMSPT